MDSWAKTLVIAEKPSVGRDLAGALPGTFKQSQDKTHLVGDEYIVSWAVGHLVGLAAPEEYDDRLKKWRFADLPIVPEKFKLVPNDDKAKKQLKAVHKLMQSDEVELIVNACDAGREGELIFAYLYETSGVRQAGQAPLAQLDDEEGDRGGLRGSSRRRGDEAARGGRPLPLRGRLARRDERDPRRLDPPARGLRRRRLARPRPDADACARRPPRARDPRLQAGALLARRSELRSSRGAPLQRPLPRRQAHPEEDATKVVEETRGKPGLITKLEKKEEREKPELLYDLTSLQRNANTLFGFSARRTLGAAQKLYEEHKAITYPRTNSRFLTSDMIGEIKPTADLVGRNGEYQEAARYVTRLDKLPLGRVVNDARVEDHHAIIPTKSEHDLGKMGEDEPRIYDLVAKRFLAIFHPEAVFERTRVETTVEQHVFRTSGRVLLEAGWKSVYGEEANGKAKEDDSGGDQSCRCSRRARRWRRARSSRCARRPSRRGASARRRSSPRWRRPARISRTPSCARR